MARFVTVVTEIAGHSREYRKKGVLIMIRQLICIAGALLAAAACAYAGEAGRIVFVVGQVNIANHGVNQGDAVHEGDEISTGSDGYVYLKTVDNGFLILRPSSRARIVNYHIDKNNPQNTRIKLELQNGVARSISGEAVKAARQNFRFNTPVAAIGVRGTDFTVFTDADTSRVAVISGGIVVSGFAGSCGPEGTGPCEGNSSHELFANQVGQMLQVKRGQAAPQLLPSSSAGVEPARADEPGKANALGGTELSLDPQKSANLQRSGLSQLPAVTPPPVVDSKPTVPAVVEVPFKEVMWGRFSAVLGKPADVSIEKMASAGSNVGINSFFAIYLVNSGSSWVLPERGSVGFALKQSESYVVDQFSHVVTPAALENAQLQVDFGKKSFATSFDLLVGQERFAMSSQGEITKDGRMYGGSLYKAGNNMEVTGIIGPDKSGNAYYLFQRLIDPKRVATGITAWGK